MVGSGFIHDGSAESDVEAAPFRPGPHSSSLVLEFAATGRWVPRRSDMRPIEDEEDGRGRERLAELTNL